MDLGGVLRVTCNTGFCISILISKYLVSINRKLVSDRLRSTPYFYAFFISEQHSYITFFKKEQRTCAQHYNTKHVHVQHHLHKALTTRYHMISNTSAYRNKYSS